MTYSELEAPHAIDPGLPEYMATHAELTRRLSILCATRKGSGSRDELTEITCLEVCRTAARKHGRAVQTWLIRSVESLFAVYPLGDDQVATEFRRNHRVVLSLYQIDTVPRVRAALCSSYVPLLSASASASSPETALFRLRDKMLNDPLHVGALRDWPEMER